MKIDDKDFVNEVRKAVAEHLDQVIYPKLLILIESRYRNSIEIIAENTAKRFYADKNKDIAETLTRVISLLVQPKIEPFLQDQ